MDKFYCDWISREKYWFNQNNDNDEIPPKEQMSNFKTSFKNNIDLIEVKMIDFSNVLLMNQREGSEYTRYGTPVSGKTAQTDKPVFKWDYISFNIL